MKPVQFLEQPGELGKGEAVQPFFFGVGVLDGPEDVEGVVVQPDEKVGGVLAEASDGFVGDSAPVAGQRRKEVWRRVAHGRILESVWG
jgi:hypothetical protein